MICQQEVLVEAVILASLWLTRDLRMTKNLSVVNDRLPRYRSRKRLNTSNGGALPNRDPLRAPHGAEESSASIQAAQVGGDTRAGQLEEPEAAGVGHEENDESPIQEKRIGAAIWKPKAS